MPSFSARKQDNGAKQKNSTVFIALVFVHSLAVSLFPNNFEHFNPLLTSWLRAPCAQLAQFHEKCTSRESQHDRDEAEGVDEKLQAHPPAAGPVQVVAKVLFAGVLPDVLVIDAKVHNVSVRSKYRIM